MQTIQPPSASDKDKNGNQEQQTRNVLGMEHLKPVFDEPPVVVIGSKGITIADIIGEFGLFQCSLALLAFIRYVCAAMMTNTGSLLAPELEFHCQVPESIRSKMLIPINGSSSNSMENFLRGKCELNLIDGTTYSCSSWNYNTTKTGLTLTDQFDLVCGRDWLRSSFQSIVTIGVISAAVVWGSFSDRHGRYLTIKVCFIWSFICGWIAYFGRSFLVYTLARSFCSFGDIGLSVSLITIVVETFGNKYREAVCVIAYTGWAFGVLIMPWLLEYFMNYKTLMLFTIVCHVATMPWLMLTIRESIRWLLVNGSIKEARDEIGRIVRINASLSGADIGACDIDKQFDLLKARFVILAEKRKSKMELEEADWSKTKTFCMSILGGLSKLKNLFASKELIIVTFTMVWITFNCELLYMTTILINSDIGDNVKLNYAIGGIMETVASIIAIGLIATITRKVSIISILVTISILCLTLALTHHIPSSSVWVLNLLKLGVSTLSSVIYVTTTELFPTNLRQTGFGLTSTLGGLGSVLSPFVRKELVDFIGLTGVFLILTLLPLTAASLVPFFLRETKGVELLDDLEDIASENFDYTRRRGSSFSKSPVTTVI